MRPQVIYGYIDIGATLWFLKGRRAEDPIHGATYFVGQTELLLRLLEQFEFKVTRRAARALEQKMNELKKRPKDAALTGEDEDELGDILAALTVTLNAESEGHVAYVATDKRYTVEKLGENVWSLFADNVKRCLPSIALTDVEEAGKCILFERPTAAAFHLMRAVESTLKEYSITAGCTVKDNSTWGSLIVSLRALPKKNDVLLDHLDAIRRNFRNPTQHPEKLYDLQEVQDLFGLCIDVINRLCKELPTKAT